MATATKDWKAATDLPEKERYGLYLASREWAVLKEQVKQRSGGICERCKINPSSAVHHLTYERKYREELEDLQDICEACHKFTHGKSNVDPLSVIVACFTGIIRTPSNISLVFTWGPEPREAFYHLGMTTCSKLCDMFGCELKWGDELDIKGYLGCRFEIEVHEFSPGSISCTATKIERLYGPPDPDTRMSAYTLLWHTGRLSYDEAFRLGVATESH